MISLLYLLPVLFPMAAGFFVILAKPQWEDRFGTICAALTVLCVAALSGTPAPLTYRLSDSMTLILSADRLSFFFMLLISVATAITAFCSCEYLAFHKRRHIFFGFLLLTLGAMMGITLSGNLVTFYMFFELMSLLSFPLILYKKGIRATRAAFAYLGFSVFGACLVLMGMFVGGELILRPFGSPEDSVLTNRQLWAYLLIAVGFSCKAGMMPLSNWLPTAHPEAPSPASALLSGVITKTGILGMIRTTFYLFGASSLLGTFPQKVLLLLSILTIFTGSMLAYKEQILKKRLAFSSVSQISYVIFGLMLLTPAGLVAALMQVFFHACAKVGLFLCAGNYLHYEKADRVEKLLGIGRRMPGVTAAFTCCSLSLIGIPPFGGFVTKFLLAGAALQEGGLLPQIGVVVLMISALLTAGYLLPIVARAYFPGKGLEYEKQDAHFPMLSSLTVLVVVLAVVGMFPGPLEAFFQTVAEAIM